MIFGLFKKKDTICGMKEEKGKGFIDEKTKNWFCNHNCKEEFDKLMEEKKKAIEKNKNTNTGGCCH